MNHVISTCDSAPRYYSYAEYRHGDLLLNSPDQWDSPVAGRVLLSDKLQWFREAAGWL